MPLQVTHDNLISRYSTSVEKQQLEIFFVSSLIECRWINKVYVLRSMMHFSCRTITIKCCWLIMATDILDDCASIISFLTKMFNCNRSLLWILEIQTLWTTLRIKLIKVVMMNTSSTWFIQWIFPVSLNPDLLNPSPHKCLRITWTPVTTYW